MKTTLFLLGLCFAAMSLSAQSSDSVVLRKIYDRDYSIVYHRDSLQKANNYELSLQKWLADTNILKSAAKHYQLAVNYAKLGNPDSAFYYLDKYVDISADDRLIFIDDAFDELRNNETKWKSLTDKIEALYLAQIPEATNKEFAIELFYLDISWANYFIYNRDSISSELFSQHYNTNSKKWMELMEKYGFPTKDDVGALGEEAAYASLKHLCISKKYYHHVKEQFQAGNFDTLAYAVITDKYLAARGKKQIYGSHLYIAQTKKNEKPDWTPILHPVQNFSNVNERRRSIGFKDTVEEFAKKYYAYIPKKYYLP